MSDILNCDRAIPKESIYFSYRCPRKWDVLESTSQQSVRFCQACQENVYYCTTKEDAEQHAKQGHCIVIDAQFSNTKQRIRGRVAIAKPSVTDD